ncbi:zinc ABC transporter substrate-binding protein [Corynebacterium mastitidis]|uniref:Zinc ABC transporter substrate-binding protein n=1 Tax=Corynebacterium mastitidis TaxID=161890 RepID=A0ABU8NVN1_9CORY
MIRPRPALLGTLAVAALAPLAACSAAPHSGDRTAIVASTSVWGDLARHVTEGTDAEVTSIITGDVTDPHHFSPSAADMARAHRASFVVVGGGGYDAWLYEGLEDSQIVHTLPLTAHSHDHEHGHEHDHGADTPLNEHVWFDVDALAAVAGEIEERVPGASAEAVRGELTALKERLGALPPARVAQTEPVADYLVEDSPLREVTPEGYRRATLSEGEPSVADLAAFLDLINSGGIDVLIYNPQTATDTTRRLERAARDNGITVVEVGETPAEGQDVIEYLTRVIHDFELI